MSSIPFALELCPGRVVGRAGGGAADRRDGRRGPGFGSSAPESALFSDPSEGTEPGYFAIASAGVAPPRTASVRSITRLFESPAEAAEAVRAALVEAAEPSALHEVRVAALLGGDFVADAVLRDDLGAQEVPERVVPVEAAAAEEDEVEEAL